MIFHRSLLLLAALIALSALSGCERDNKAASTVAVVPKTIDDHFAIKVGDRTVSMQVAANRQEMEHGLMFRTALEADEGMLFIYEKPQQMNFWMRNTLIPLNIGFFDAEGVLKETHEMFPRDERTKSSHNRDLLYALEMNEGWFSRNGVKPGAKLDLKAVAEALKARGHRAE